MNAFAIQQTVAQVNGRLSPRSICGRLAVLIGLFAVFVASPTPCAGSPIVVDFESLGFAEGTQFASIVGVNGITFENIIYVLPGNPIVAFSGNNLGGPGGPDSANTGDSISASDGSGAAGIIRSTSPLADISLLALDIEQSPSVNEFLTVKLFDDENAGTQLASFTLLGTAPGADDGLAVPISFPGISGVHRIEFNGRITANSSAGYGVDDLSFTVVPEPATLVMLAVGIPSVFACRCRRRYKVRLRRA